MINMGLIRGNTNPYVNLTCTLLICALLSSLIGVEYSLNSLHIFAILLGVLVIPVVLIGYIRNWK